MHWLSFDEPQSRLKKALKRSQFFQDLLNSPDQSTPFSSSEISIRLAALAFALADISRFNSVCFNSVPAALNFLKPHSQGFYDALLDRIHAGMTNYLRGNYKWTEGETVWAAICVEYIATSWRSQNSAKDDVLTFFTAVEETISASINANSATECSALVEDAIAAFDDCFQNSKRHLKPDFLPEKLLLVEGRTEAILLPLFAEMSDFEFQKNRVLMISGGGANQVAKRFLGLRQATKLPIACLLDGDAESQYDVIRQHLGETDLLFSLSAGEFEDTFELSVFVDLLNRYLQSMTGVNAPSLVEYEPLSADQLEPAQKRTHVLNKVWRAKSLGNFDKVEFASFVFQNIKKAENIPADLQLFIGEMKDRWGN